MKRYGILNPELLRALASLGHTDQVVICDAGLPIPKDAWRVDLSVVKGLPSFVDVLDVVLREFVVEGYVVASEVKEANPNIYAHVRHMLFGRSGYSKEVPHEEFKAMAAKSKVYIRTGECTPYANIILISGVSGVFDGGDDRPGK